MAEFTLSTTFVVLVFLIDCDDDGSDGDTVVEVMVIGVAINLEGEEFPLLLELVVINIMPLFEW